MILKGISFVGGGEKGSDLVGFTLAWACFMTKAKYKTIQVRVQIIKLYILSSPINTYINLCIFPGISIYLSTLQKVQSHQILFIYISTSNKREHLLVPQCTKYLLNVLKYLLKSIIKFFWSNF